MKSEKDKVGSTSLVISCAIVICIIILIFSSIGIWIGSKFDNSGVERLVGGVIGFTLGSIIGLWVLYWFWKEWSTNYLRFFLVCVPVSVFSAFLLSLAISNVCFGTFNLLHIPQAIEIQELEVERVRSEQEARDKLHDELIELKRAAYMNAQWTDEKPGLSFEDEAHLIQEVAPDFDEVSIESTGRFFLRVHGVEVHVGVLHCDGSFKCCQHVVDLDVLRAYLETEGEGDE